MAVPRLAPYDGDAVALPRPLARADATLLRRLFASRTATADVLRAAAPLDRTIWLNDQLLATVLAERYVRLPSHASASALATWLQRYADLPAAVAIGALLRRHDPNAAVPLDLAADKLQAAAAVDARPAERAPLRRPALEAAIAQRLQNGHFDAAARLIARGKGLDPVYAATLQAGVAQAMFTHDLDSAALGLAADASVRAKGGVGLAEYVAGLAARGLGRAAEALSHFAAAAHAPVATPALRAAAFYWAARASFEAGDTARGRDWLVVAAAERQTFYGQIAARMVALSDGQTISRAVLGEADVEAVAAEPGGQRAFALLQIGQASLAEAELRLLAARRGGLARSIMLVADRAGLIDLAAALDPRGAILAADRLPVRALWPRNGFLMDPALVYALTRIESNFQDGAVSPMERKA